MFVGLFMQIQARIAAYAGWFSNPFAHHARYQDTVATLFFHSFYSVLVLGVWGHVGENEGTCSWWRLEREGERGRERESEGEKKLGYDDTQMGDSFGGETSRVICWVCSI